MGVQGEVQQFPKWSITGITLKNVLLIKQWFETDRQDVNFTSDLEYYAVLWKTKYIPRFNSF